MLGKDIEEEVFSSCHERGTSDLRIPRFDAIPLNHRDSTVSELY